MLQGSSAKGRHWENPSCSLSSPVHRARNNSAGCFEWVPQPPVGFTSPECGKKPLGGIGSRPEAPLFGF